MDMSREESIEQIQVKLEKIKFGYPGKDKKNLWDNKEQKWKSDPSNSYQLQTPEELIKSKCGTSWDQVELERMYLQKENIGSRSYIMMIKEKETVKTHTFLTFKNPVTQKECWLENAWEKYKGLHEYQNKSDLLEDVIKKFQEEQKVGDALPFIYLYEYKKPSPHLTKEEFLDYVETTNRMGKYLTYNGKDLLKEYRKKIGEEAWETIRKEKMFWLPNPIPMKKQDKIIFTTKGFLLFRGNILPLILEELEDKNIKLKTIRDFQNVIYKDEYQIIIGKR